MSTSVAGITTLANNRGTEFDAVIVGSGPGGATVARELTRLGKRVLILERGRDIEPRDGLIHMARVASMVGVGDRLGVARAMTTGGTTALYFGVAEYPPLAPFLAVGIDLAEALAEARSELKLVEPLSDHLLGKQVLKVAESAKALGIPWMKTEAMLIDESKCKNGFSYSAIWRAKSYVDEAVRDGATLINRARVTKVLVEAGRAIGVEYELQIGRRSEIRQAYGTRIVIAAGAMVTPKILQASGVANIGNRGFYCDPGFMLTGSVDGLKGGEVIPGCMGTNSEEDGILVGDGCLSRSMYFGYMLGTRNFMKLFGHRKHIGVGVMVRDGLGGEFRADGSLYKDFTHEERQKMEKGGELAQRIMLNAGAKNIIRSDVSGAHVGGLMRIGEHLDASLQTEIANLHACDCSVLPESVRGAPVFTLVCVGKYLAKRLAALL